LKYLSSIFLCAGILIFLQACSDLGSNPNGVECQTLDACGVCDGDGSTCNISFSRIQSIFNTYCTSCHGTQGGLSLTSYDEMMQGGNSGAVVTPGDHTNSYLWQKINDGSMPPSGEKPTTADLNTIATWIDEGASSQ